MNNTIVLFDMDGTLTESRKEFNSKDLEDSLYQLTNAGVHIGIITGSDLNYLQEQMGDFLNNSSCRYKTHLLPCNGTKYLKPPQFATDDYQLTHNVSMKKQLGNVHFKELMQEIIYSQVDICCHSIPLTGHFIDYRGSMINWCPIGRNANSEEREKFVKLDKDKSIRLKVLEELKAMLELKNLSNKVTIKLGGDTSFDIYPKNWDKTYGLKHFPNWDTWFVGDRCYENGNDYEIYLECQGKSYKTSGPTETAQIVQQILLKLKGIK